MIRPFTGLFSFLGLVILAGIPAALSPAYAAQDQGARSIIGILPLEVAEIQRDADYTRDHHAYFNPTFGLIALGVGALLGLAWLLGADPALKLRGDPVPSRVRIRLNRLDSARLGVLAAVRASKSHSPVPALSEAKTLYDRLAADVDDILDKVRRDLLLNLVDETNLIPALDTLTDRAHGLSFQLRRIAPVPWAVSDEKDLRQLGQVAFWRINRGWERVFSGESAKTTTIRQLSSMRWPSWSRIETPPRRPA